MFADNTAQRMAKHFLVRKLKLGMASRYRAHKAASTGLPSVKLTYHNISCVQVLLEAAMARPESPLRDLNLLSKSEKVITGVEISLKSAAVTCPLS